MQDLDKAMDEAVMNQNETDGFIGEVWMSTDGKHTVHGKAMGASNLKNMRQWVADVYKIIEEQKGTKQAQAKREYSGEEDLGKCSKCGAKNIMSSKGKPYCSAKCWLS